MVPRDRGISPLGWEAAPRNLANLSLSARFFWPRLWPLSIGLPKPIKGELALGRIRNSSPVVGNPVGCCPTSAEIAAKRL